MNRRVIAGRFSRIVTWKRGDQRAPHKPLTLLLALAAVRAGERWLAFEDVEPRLRDLLVRFGPPRKVTHPEHPFYRLVSDGFWVLDQDLASRENKSGDVSAGILRESHASAGFTDDVYTQLSADPVLVEQIVADVLNEHFPASYHAELLEAIRFGPCGATAPSRRSRDPRFREEVLRAYEYACAVCGFDLRLRNEPVALEAAHVMWHQAGGPDVVKNGLALCVMHHKLFDRGALGLDDEARVLVSEYASGATGFEEQVLKYGGRPARPPVRPEYHLERDFIAWHRREVFREPARAAAP